MTEEAKVSDEKSIQDGKIFAVVAYIGILCLLPLLLKKENGFALHHGKQGLVIFIAEVLSGALLLIPFLGWVISPILSVVLLIYSIVGIIQAVSGKYWKAPIVAELADKINI